MTDTRLPAAETQQTILATIATVFRNKGLEPPTLTMDTSIGPWGSNRWTSPR
jgi:hypothetical protein